MIYGLGMGLKMKSSVLSEIIDDWAFGFSELFFFSFF